MALHAQLSGTKLDVSIFFHALPLATLSLAIIWLDFVLQQNNEL